MNIPLNIDWQQILLHLLNFTILGGGLYLLLYKPVKGFMDQRTAHYQELDDQAADKVRQAEELKAEYETKLENAQEEIRAQRVEAQNAAQLAVQQQLDQAQAQADQIVAAARKAAERSHAKALEDAQEELKDLALAAAEKLLFRSEGEAFDQFLNIAEEGARNEKTGE